MQKTNSSLVITGGRIKEERIRLNLSQAEAAAQCACVRETWGKYERGVFDMNTETLRAFGALGADMLYILTNIRSVAVSPQALLPEGDRILLDNFHASPPGVQEGVKTTLGAFAPQAGIGPKKRKAG